MEWYHVYLLTRLAGLNVLVGLSTLVVGIAAAILAVVWAAHADMASWSESSAKDAATYKKLALRSILLFVVLALLTVAIPTQKEAAAIYLLPKLAKSDFAKEAGQIPTDAAKLLRLKLESWIADMEPPKPKKD